MSDDEVPVGGVVDAGDIVEEDEASATSTFYEPVSFISWTRGSVRGNPYAFVVAGGEVYIPGYLISDHEVKVGDLVAGTRRVATAGRLPYRATAVDSVDPPAYEEPRSDDDDNESAGLPEQRGSDDASSEDSSADFTSLAQRLFAYVEKHHGEIKLAAPPQVKGSIAHFYKNYPHAAAVIKKYEPPEGGRAGAQSFVRQFPDLFVVAGKHPQLRVVAKGSKAEARYEAEKKEMLESQKHADNHATHPTHKHDNNPKASKSKYSEVAAGTANEKKGKNSNANKADAATNGHANANGKGQNHSGSANATDAPGVSRAAKEAAQRAAAAATSQQQQARQPQPPPPPSPPTAPFVPSSGGGFAHSAPHTDGSDMREQLAGLRSDLSVAMVALASARERMSRLETTIGMQMGAAAFSISSSAA